MSDTTPNVVIPDPRTRRVLGVVLYVIAVLAGVASFVAAGLEVSEAVDFWVAKVTGVVAILSGAFGLGVTTPNVPRVAPVITDLPSDDGPKHAA